MPASVTRSLVALQVALIIALAIAPAGVLAADPSPDPSASPTAPADPSPSPEPTAPPDPTASPDTAPTAEPPADPTPDPTAEPTPTDTPAPPADPTNAPDSTTAPSDPAPVAAPSITSDKADYAPGELVTLTGAGWQPGESVHIFVNDDWGSSWSRNVDVTADGSGAIADSFNLPGWFVALYSVVTTGASSGVVRTTFTDADNTITTITSSVNPSTVGQSVTFTATVRLDNNAAVTDGQVKFGTGGNCTGGFSQLQAVQNVNGSGQVTYTTSALVATTTIRACYIGTGGGGTQDSTATIQQTITAANQAPSATNLSAAETYIEDTAKDLVNIVVTDVDSTTVTATLTLSNLSAGSLTTGTSGSVTSIFSAGVWTATGPIANVNTLLAGVSFAPASNFNGSFTIGVSVTDGIAAPVTGLKNVTGTPVNDAPSGADNTITILEDGSRAFAAADFGFSDPSDIPANAFATVKITSLPAAGGLTLASVAVSLNQVIPVASLGTLVFTPANNASGAPYATFTFQVQDNGGALNGGVDLDQSANTITVNVTAVNDAPQATNLSAAETYIEDTAKDLVNIVVTDVDSTTVTATLTLSNLSAGSLTTGTSGSVTSIFSAGVWTATGPIANVNTLLAGVSFAPASNFNGSFTIGVSVTDGIAAPVTGLKNVTGTPVNDAPVPAADSATTAEDTAVAVNVTGNDSAGPANEAGQTVAVKPGSISAPAHGTAVLVTTGPDLGKIRYTPAADYNGSDSFTYEICDDGTTNGIADPQCSTGSATVSITVTEVNDAPTAVDDSRTTAEDTALVIDPRGNDSRGPANESGQTLTITAVGSPAHGTAVLIVGGADDGKIRYTPAADYNGPDSFTYDITDNGTTNGANDFKSDQGEISMTVTEVNDAPVPAADSATTAEDTAVAVNVTGNDSAGPANEAGQTVAVKPGSISAPAHGTAVLVTTGPDLGKIRYTPAADYNGSDSFTYEICDDGTTNGIADPQCSTGSATVSITVTEVNDAPTAVDDSRTTAEDTALVIDPRGNDSRGPANESGQTLTITAVGSPAHGTAVLIVGGADDGKIRYTPAADYNGPDSFTYDITDNGTTNGANDFKSDQGEISMTVTEVNDAPVPAADSATTAEDTAVAVNVTGNDSAGPANEAGQTVAVKPGSISAPAHGTAVLVTTGPDLGKIRYTPAADYNGSDSFTYEICDDGTTNGIADPQCSTGSATVSITVTEVNDAPTAVDDSRTTAEDTALVIDPRGNDSRGPANESGQTLTITAVGSPAHGTAVLIVGGADDGKIRYTPAADYNGPDSFTYDITDNGTTNGANDFKSDQGEISMTVTEVNDAPVPAADSATTAEDTAVAVNVTGNDSAGPANEAGQTVAVKPGSISAPAHGTAVLVTTGPDLGKIRYTPAADYNGSDSFTYEICDDGTTNGIADPQCSTGSATVSITVTEVNDAPTAVDDSRTTAEDTALVIDPRGNDSRGPANESGQTLTITAVGSPAHGTAVLIVGGADDGKIRYTPAADYNGPDSFTYDITDNGTTNGANDFKSDQGEISMTVTEVNDAPSNVLLSFSAAPTNEGSPVGARVTFLDAEIDQSYTCTFEWGDGSTDTVTTGVGARSCGKAHTYLDDNPTATASDAVTVKVIVLDNGKTNGINDFKSSSVSQTITVANVVPTTSTPAFTFDPVTHVATASMAFADQGTADTHPSTYFAWTVDGVTTNSLAGVSESSGAGNATSSRVLTNGCHTISVIGYAVDDDTGTSLGQIVSATYSADAYVAAFQAPIKDGERNVTKYGNVVPVKVQINSSCTGAAITTATLYITLVKGSYDSVDDGTNVLATSVSSADTGNQMRPSGSGYIFNLSTNGLQQGSDYTIRIRVGDPLNGTIIQQAVLQPKK